MAKHKKRNKTPIQNEAVDMVMNESGKHSASMADCRQIAAALSDKFYKEYKSCRNDSYMAFVRNGKRRAGKRK